MTVRLGLGSARLREILLRQDGVISRRQMLECGVQPHDVERMVRRRELRRVVTGVYINHTGPLTRRQREWVAVLAAWPAALAAASALPGPTPAKVQIAIARGRTVRRLDGVAVKHVSDLQNRVHWHRSPPRLRIEEAAIDEMSRRIAAGDIAGAFSDLTRIAYSRKTTAERIAEALAGRGRVAGRALIAGMLQDWRDGVCSVLERGYRDHVERAHGLPRASRQHTSTATGGTTFQDVRYDAYSFVVELDGLVFHSDPAARDRDALRDLAELAATGAPTARVTYGLVFRSACLTAESIGEILRQRGWTGELRPCPRCA